MGYKDLGVGTPDDGYSQLEKNLLSAITSEGIKGIYAKLPTSRMKFIVAAHFELGYPQEFVAEMLKIKQPSLQDEIKHIRRVLTGQPYRPHKHKGTITLEDLMKMVLLLQKP